MLVAMISRRRILVVALCLAAVGAAGWQGRARACTPAPPPCVQVPPPDAAAFPANAVAFRILDVIGGPRTYDQLLNLRTAVGDVRVPASVKVLPGGERVFSPEAPLQPGARYVLRYDGACFGGPGMSKPQELAFVATEALPFPENAGRLELIAQGTRDPRTGPFLCAGFARLRLVDSPESAPFRALRTFVVHVDDEGAGGDPRFTLGASPDIQVDAYCPEAAWLRGPCGDLQSVPPGRRRVKVTSHILGAPVHPAPQVQEIELRCDVQACPGPEIFTPVPAPPEPAPQPTGSGRPPAAAPARSDATASGCSVAAARPRPGAFAVLLGLFALRRRRSRARPR